MSVPNSARCDNNDSARPYVKLNDWVLYSLKLAISRRQIENQIVRKRFYKTIQKYVIAPLSGWGNIPGFHPLLATPGHCGPVELHD